MFHLLDSISDFDPLLHTGVTLTGSHGAANIIDFLHGARLQGIVVNDAGSGKDDAGVSSLSLLDAFGLPAAAVSHRSSRIGLASDTLEYGLISRFNLSAARAGVSRGMTAINAADLLRLGQSVIIPSMRQNLEPDSRILLPGRGRTVILADSASSVLPEDTGRIIVTGSHGGLVGGHACRSLSASAFAAFFNDAGRGSGNAGIARLTALQERGIAGIAVAADSARIGSALSTYKEGIVSALNDRALSLGILSGQSVLTAVERLRNI